MTTRRITWESYAAGMTALGIVALWFTLGGASVSNVFAATTSTQQTINLTVNETIQLTVQTPVNLPALTPGSPVTATSSATVVTNSDTGWRLQVRRDSVTSTLAYGATSTFPDYTSWDPTGSGNATTTPGQTLSFRVQSSGTTAALYNSTYWGATDADGTAKYAGHPTSSQTVATRSDYASGNQFVILKLRADAPSDQRSGAYTGTITVTAITNP